jgi:hypothetical protein
MRTIRQSVKRVGRIGVVAALVLLTASCVTGPILGPGDISLATGPNVTLIGYQRSEFFVAGVATSYAPTAPLTSDGKWEIASTGTRSAFKTRVVVYRPIDASKFNGTVVVEWLNVSTGGDLPTDWLMAHNEFVRSGAVWVGVSAQAVGVNALKSSAAARYGPLVHPGDSFSYDMFSQAGIHVRNGTANLLTGLVPERIIAAGESQSAGRLVTYLDAVHPIASVYDGFMVHSRGAGGAPLSQPPQPAVTVPSPLQIRDDLDVPVMVVQAEGDVIGTNLGARQPDTPMFRVWEMAGTAHADAYTAQVGFGDIGDGNGAVLMFERMRTPPDLGCESPINAGPHHWILQAAFHHLDVWVRNGVAPPTAPLLEVASTSPVVLARDPQGNALGGVRSPHVDAPVATLTGINAGAGFCRLFGSTTPLTPAELAALYPTHDDFVAAWAAAIYVAGLRGYLLPADGAELLNAAWASQIPN